MGGEFGQRNEWDHDESLDWHLLQYSEHKGVQKWVQDLNRLYKEEKALYEIDFDPKGLEWICSDWENSILAFLRRGKSEDDLILSVFNFTPVPRHDYQIGIPKNGSWKELLNSDGEEYGGSDLGNLGGVKASATPKHGKDYSLSLTLPPLGALFFKREK
ncbi:hypothetical protein AKJ49_02235 [candidate division MSBL1 archaeon SCGC-AAA382A03]|uniref:Alpha-amylase/branching enzyme C-terminal all beta domain-containing protein n=1 Tax=candidate division MSBL1 archaeon SCGC-AAA382A03 TaxID=1698278 RepID=A0A133VD00_9EURY|nr:hypothetical protein AKJ49_02235 [candidate division MSBL1 archaeon SCGC-AAA382A03]